jgi:dienelactone hydrolase
MNQLEPASGPERALVSLLSLEYRSEEAEDAWDRIEAFLATILHRHPLDIP